MSNLDLVKPEWCRQGDIRTSDALGAGWKLFRRKWHLMIATWVAATAVGLPLLWLIPQDLSTALSLAFVVGGPLVLFVAHRLVRGIQDGQLVASRRSLWLTATAVLAGLAAIAFIFRFTTFYTWFAMPLSGAIAYAFVTFGARDFLAAGRLDMLVGATVYGLVGFGVTIGFLFAPLRAVHDGTGPITALRHSWRMIGGSRWLLLKVFTVCLGVPASLCVSAFALSYARFSVAHFAGTQAVLWCVSIGSLALLFGPWLTCTLAVLYVPMKAQHERQMARLAQRKASMGLS